MGQYHVITNLTKRAGYVPRSLGNGIKLMEFGADGFGAMGALVHLLNASWGGDRIAIVGDYAEAGDLSAEATEEAGTSADKIFGFINNSSGTGWRNVGWLARKVSPGRFTDEKFGGFTAHRFYPQPRWESEPRVIINTDRQEVLTPSGFGDDERIGVYTVGGGRGGILSALAVVLAVANKGGARGGGDLHNSLPVVGSWGGDHLKVVAPADVPAGYTVIDGDVRLALTDGGEAWYMADENGNVRRFDVWAEELTQLGTAEDVERFVKMA